MAKGDDDVSLTLVRTIKAKGAAATEMTLTHGRFRDSDMRAKHEQGWTGCLVKLEKLLAIR